MPGTFDITPVLEFLPCRTPRKWVEYAIRPENLGLLLIDHCHNERKAAETALSIIRRYGTMTGMPAVQSIRTMPRSYKNVAGAVPTLEQSNVMGQSAEGNTTVWQRKLFNKKLLNKMSRLAREEMRHFEQVLAIMDKRGIDYQGLGASRYAGMLRQPIRKQEPGRLVDSLIVGAFIEARSCERFYRLAPHLDEEIGRFYTSLLKSESRHFEDYLALAREVSREDIAERIQLFAHIEREAVESVDLEFRFHSGVLKKAALV